MGRLEAIRRCGDQGSLRCSVRWDGRSPRRVTKTQLSALTPTAVENLEMGASDLSAVPECP